MRFRRLAASVVLTTLAAGGAAFGQATTRPAVESSTDSAFVPAGYVKVFSDEMNQPQLDTSKWWTRYIYENGTLASLNDEKQLFSENDNHVMTGTALALTARVHQDEKKPKYLYQSGMIRSKTTFKYGYFEARIKLPAAKGVWPAFWLNSDADKNGKVHWPPEVDIFEFVNNGKEDRVEMLHSGVVDRTKTGEKSYWEGGIIEADPKFKPRGSNRGGAYYAPFNFPGDYHIFAALWDTDDTFTILVDNKKIVKYRYKWMWPTGEDAPYAHVLLNLAIGGQWPGRHGIDDAAFPQAMTIDYVRVYQKADKQLTGESTIGHDFLKPAQP